MEETEKTEKTEKSSKSDETFSSKHAHAFKSLRTLWRLEAYVLIVERRTCECCGSITTAAAHSTRVRLCNSVTGAIKTISLEELRERMHNRAMYDAFIAEGVSRALPRKIKSVRNPELPNLPRAVWNIDTWTEYCEQCFVEYDFNQLNFWPRPNTDIMPPSTLEILYRMKEQDEERAKLNQGDSRTFLEMLKSGNSFGEALKNLKERKSQKSGSRSAKPKQDKADKAGKSGKNKPKPAPVGLAEIIRLAHKKRAADLKAGKLNKETMK